MKHLVDARGLACPLPVVNTKNEINGMAAGETVEVLVDNEIAVQNLTKFARVRNHTVSSKKAGEDCYRVLITVGGTAGGGTKREDAGGASEDAGSESQARGETGREADGQAYGGTGRENVGRAYGDAVREDQAQPAADSDFCKPCKKNGSVVALSSNKMGDGEKELGKALMKAFLFALTKQDIYPEKIFLYNSGAFLSCEGSDSLEDLRLLESQGVEIFTCGTCLNYYGLTDSLAVGSVTNMYDIVEGLSGAEKIIRP